VKIGENSDHNIDSRTASLGSSWILNSENIHTYVPVYLSLQKTDTSAAWPRLPTSLLVRATPFFFHLRRQKIGQNFAFRNHPKQKHLHMYLHTDLESFLFKFGCRCDPSASQYLPIVRHSTYQLCVTVPINCASQYQPIVSHSTYQEKLKTSKTSEHLVTSQPGHT
jgi:hypothetical protein